MLGVICSFSIPERLVGEGELADLLDHRQLGIDAVDRRSDRAAEGGQLLQLGKVAFLAVGLGPVERPFGVGHDKPGQVRPLVAAHHRLRDLGPQRQHPFELLRRDIVALVVDDHVLLAIGDDDPAFLVEMPDVARVEPAVPERALGLGLVLPVSLHH